MNTQFANREVQLGAIARRYLIPKVARECMISMEEAEEVINELMQSQEFKDGVYDVRKDEQAVVSFIQVCIFNIVHKRQDPIIPFLRKLGAEV